MPSAEIRYMIVAFWSLRRGLLIARTAFALRHGTFVICRPLPSFRHFDSDTYVLRMLLWFGTGATERMTVYHHTLYHTGEIAMK